MFEAINLSSSYIRAVSLEVGSVEFFTLLAAVLISAIILFKYKGTLLQKLFLVYVFFIPFTDRVYRLKGVLEPTEVLAIIIILIFIFEKLVKGGSFSKKTGLHIKYMGGLFLLFLFSLLLPTFYYFHPTNSVIDESLSTSLAASLKTFPFFNWLYLIRFGLIVVLLYIFYQVVDKKFFEKNIKTYIWAGSFASVVGMAQVALFVLGHKVAGVFFLAGFPRVKGLAHEPATFGAFLLSSLALTFFLSNKKLKLRKLHIVLQTIGLALTMSASAIPIYVIFLVFLTVQGLMKRIKLKELYFYYFLIAIILVGFFSSGFIKPETISYTTEKLGFYVKEMVTGQNLGSGRGGDIYYLKEALKERPVFGIGIFNFVFYPTEAANTFFMLFAELGAFGFSIFLFLTIFFYWGVFKLNQSKRYKISPYALPLFTFILTIPFQFLALRVLNFHYIWFMIALFITIEKIEWEKESTNIRIRIKG